MNKLLFILIPITILGCSHQPKNTIELGESFINKVLLNEDLNLVEFAERYNLKIDSTDDFGIETAKKFIKNNTEIIFIDSTEKFPSIFKIYDKDNCSYKEEFVDAEMITFYFKKENDYLALDLNYTRDSIGHITLNYIDTLTLSYQCKRFSDYYSENGCLYAADFRAFPGNSKFQFSSAKIFIENKSKEKVDSILIQCQIAAHPENYFFYKRIKDSPLLDPFYSRTFMYKNPIHPDEIANIELPEVNKYYSSIEITRKNFDTSYEIIKSYPKPEIYYCNKIHQLDSILGK